MSGAAERARARSPNHRSARGGVRHFTQSRGAVQHEACPASRCADARRALCDGSREATRAKEVQRVVSRRLDLSVVIARASAIGFRNESRRRMQRKRARIPPASFAARRNASREVEEFPRGGPRRAALRSPISPGPSGRSCRLREARGRSSRSRNPGFDTLRRAPLSFADHLAFTRAPRRSEAPQRRENPRLRPRPAVGTRSPGDGPWNGRAVATAHASTRSSGAPRPSTDDLTVP